MSLLNVTVKKARYLGVQAQQFNTYVTLKLQNVKSTTITVKGANPCWEQDFLFETNDINIGLLVEVWYKGMLWDRALGYHYIPLPEVSYSNQNGSGQWLSLDSELEMRGGEVVGTKTSTGHTLLIDCRFELPLDAEDSGAIDLQRKLERLNNITDQESRAEQARRQMIYNTGHSGYSEDSDYTSDLNFPVGEQGANSSVSQFRSAANQLATPQRSLETSRENSYERDDQQVPTTLEDRLPTETFNCYMDKGYSPRFDEPYPKECFSQRYLNYPNVEASEPLFYNSRPKNYTGYRSRQGNEKTEPSLPQNREENKDSWYIDTYNCQGLKFDEKRIYSDAKYSHNMAVSTFQKRGSQRRPSLERQATLYDEHLQFDRYSSDSQIGMMGIAYFNSNNYQGNNKHVDSVIRHHYHNERHGQDDEDRQWDSGGIWYSKTYNENKCNRKSLPEKLISSISIHRPDYNSKITRQHSYESEENDCRFGSRKRKFLQSQHSSRTEGIGKKLPPTPTKMSNVFLGMVNPVSLSSAPGRRKSSLEESYYNKSSYNEDYNYAYLSEDNLPQGIYDTNNQTKQSFTQMHIIDDVPDNQHGTNYVSECTNIVCDRTSIESQTHDVYKLVEENVQNPYTDYQQSYLQSINNSQLHTYNESYQDTTYLNINEHLPIYQCEKTQEMIIRKPFQSNIKQIVRPIVKQQQYQNNEYKEEYINNLDKDRYQEYSDRTFKNNKHHVKYYNQLLYDNQYNNKFSDQSFESNQCSTFDGQNMSDIINQVIIIDEGNVCDHYKKNNQDIDISVTNYQEPYKNNDKQTSVSVTISQDVYQNFYKTQPIYAGNSSYNKEENSRTCTNNYKNQCQMYDVDSDNSYQHSYQESFVNQFKVNLCNEMDQTKTNLPNLSLTIASEQMEANGCTSPESKYYSQSKNSEDMVILDSERRKILKKDDIKLLHHQNTDLLEPNNELQGSFETAVRSINNSHSRKTFSKYSMIKESSSACIAINSSPQNYIQTFNSITNNGSNQVDLIHGTKDVTTYHNIPINCKHLLQTESYSKELIKNDDYSEVSSKEFQKKESQLSHASHQNYQSQTSEDSIPLTQNQNFMEEDSYTSDKFSIDFVNSRKESFSQLNVKDSYVSIIHNNYSKPLLRLDSYQSKDHKGSTHDQNFIAPQPISRAESYQRGYFKDQKFIDDTEITPRTTVNGKYKMTNETLQRCRRGEGAMIKGCRDDSLIEIHLSDSSRATGSIKKQVSLDESVQMDTPPRSPLEISADDELHKISLSSRVPTPINERPEITPKQRWHLAFNKIVIQLNKLRDFIGNIQTIASETIESI